MEFVDELDIFGFVVLFVVTSENSRCSGERWEARGYRSELAFWIVPEFRCCGYRCSLSDQLTSWKSSTLWTSTQTFKPTLKPTNHPSKLPLCTQLGSQGPQTGLDRRSSPEEYNPTLYSALFKLAFRFLKKCPKKSKKPAFPKSQIHYSENSSKSCSQSDSTM